MFYVLSVDYACAGVLFGACAVGMDKIKPPPNELTLRVFQGLPLECGASFFGVLGVEICNEPGIQYVLRQNPALFLCPIPLPIYQILQLALLLPRFQQLLTMFANFWRGWFVNFWFVI